MCNPARRFAQEAGYVTAKISSLRRLLIHGVYAQLILQSSRADSSRRRLHNSTAIPGDGPIRTRGARRHGVMPGAGTFLHRVDQSERRTVEAWRDAGRWNFSAGI